MIRLTRIEDGTFFNCANLKKITIGNNVTSIGRQTLSWCKNLIDVYCYTEDVPETDEYSFYSSSLSSCTLHVPAASVEAYRAAERWKEFSVITPLTDEEMSIRNPSILSGIDAPVYDLSGRQHPSMQKGINIIGRKKIMKF